jgi:hypothetical protein
MRQQLCDRTEEVVSVSKEIVPPDCLGFSSLCNQSVVKSFPSAGSVSGARGFAGGSVVTEMAQSGFERAMATKQVNP